MANVNHKDLTGVSLHEPKGVAAASSGKVYIADGAASGAWTTLDKVKVAILQYKENDGVDGDDWPQTTFSAIDLNDEKFDPDSIVTLASKQFTLVAGTYLVEGVVSIRHGERENQAARLRIRNTTDSTTAGLGTNFPIDQPSISGSVRHGGTVTVSAGFVISGTKVYELQGVIVSSGEKTGEHDGLTVGDEIYATLVIWKLK